MNPILRQGLAVVRKKITDKSRVVDVDQKAIDTAEFIENIEMFGSQWNVFEDSRGWQWTQEAENDNTGVRIELTDDLPIEEEPEQEASGTISAQ